MEETSNLLSSKITISAAPEKPEISSHKNASFYIHYSSFVLKSLQKHSFQKFLHKMLKEENIKEHRIAEVNVKVFPFRSGNGRGLAGKCDLARGKIQIYPKTMTFCLAFKQKFGKKTFLAYACNRARAALIHELLHLKYATDEKRVRKLSQKHFLAFAQKKTPHCRLSLLCYIMVFAARQPLSSIFLIETTKT
jgi:hypothetical protein